MRIFVYSPRYVMDLKGHVFPTEKYRLLAERLVREGVLRPEDFVEPYRPSPQDLELVHTPEYLRDLLELRWTYRTMYSEMPLTQEIVEGFFLMAGGTHRAAELALEHGGGFHIGGGFHHAYADHAEGFCYINDLAYAIRKLQQEGRIQRALVVDCDLHQGNGTAAIFRENPEVFTFSIHQEYLYPWPKEHSDLDIGLDGGVGDEEYLTRLAEAIPRIYDEHRPEIILYQAGADPYVEDQLGDLRLSKEGLRARDERVIGEARKRDIPVVVTLGGGYARRVEDVVDIHYTTAQVLLKHLKGGKLGREDSNLQPPG